MGILVKLNIGLSFQRNFDANLKRGHNDTNSSDKDKLIKAQLLSLHVSIFKTQLLNIDLHS